MKVKNSTCKVKKIKQHPRIKNIKLMIEYNELLQKITIIEKKKFHIKIKLKIIFI
jgi:hypothetical protein